jgi:hypothetical protein
MKRDYLGELKAELGKGPTPGTDKTAKTYKDSSASSKGATPGRGFVGFGSTQGTRFSPPLEAGGETTRGYCPTCGGGEFWRHPRFHPDHDKGGWRCLSCLPVPDAVSSCDFAGVPDGLFPRDDDPFESLKTGKEPRYD